MGCTERVGNPNQRCGVEVLRAAVYVVDCVTARSLDHIYLAGAAGIFQLIPRVTL